MALEYRFEKSGGVQLHSDNKENRWCWIFLIIALIIMIAFEGWLYLRGYWTPADSSGAQAISLRGKMNEQAGLLAEQKKQIEQLETDLISAKREKAIQVTANQELNNKLLSVEDQLSDSRKKLLLYENILSAKDLKQGLHIQYFTMRMKRIDKEGQKLKDTQHYQYHLVIAHVRGNNTASGGYLVKIKGKHKGKDASFAHTKIAEQGAETVTSKFSVKYYQSLEGSIVLPDDFTPETVEVSLKPSSGSSITKTYPWKSFAGEKEE